MARRNPAGHGPVPRPKDPLLELTLQEREDLRQAACDVHPATFIEARYREEPSRVEHARVECAPYKDGKGSVFARITRCERNIREKRWECAQGEATVETHVAGYPVSIRYYDQATLPQALEAVNFLLSMPDVHGIESSRFTLSEMSVRQTADGLLSLEVLDNRLRITLFLERVQSEDYVPFRIRRVSRGSSDVIHLDADDPLGLNSIAPKYK